MHICSDCGAKYLDDLTCETAFHQFLFWESEDPTRGEVHHLTVFCYHLQHPGLFAPQGLQAARRLLTDFVVHGLAPQEVRRRERNRVSSDRRNWPIKARPEAQGNYSQPVRWTMTAAEVLAAGPDAYLSSVQAWANSVLIALQEVP